MPDVFVSYARTTAKAARRVAEGLRSAGYTVWVDEELPANRAYADVISEQLEQAKAVVVLWSHEAAASHWVRSEANRAREKQKLVQVTLDGSPLPMPFDQIQSIDFRRWRGHQTAQCWRKLVASIADLAGGEERSPTAGRPGEPAPLPFGRRTALIGGAAALTAASFIGWRLLTPDQLPAEAQLQFDRARHVMQYGRPEEVAQAIAYLQEVTRLAPEHAPAWGALAVVYAYGKFQLPVAERAGYDARCRSAAKTALRIDANEPLARCALALVAPPFGRWAASEHVARALVRRHPEHPLAISILGAALADGGRWREAVSVYDRSDRGRHVGPIAEYCAVLALWSAGELQRAEATLEEASKRWPQHRAIWHIRINFLTHSGRSPEAVRLLESDSAPTDYGENERRSALVTARALSGSLSAGEAVGTILSLLGENPALLTVLNRKTFLAQLAAQRCAALGDRATAMDLFEGFYLGRGSWARLAPAAGNEDRSTMALFEPPTSGLRHDPRYMALLERLGLRRA